MINTAQALLTLQDEFCLVARGVAKTDNGDTMQNNVVGSVILRRLKEMNRSQDWLREETGVSKTAVHYWIKTGKITIDNAFKVAELLEVSVEELFGRAAPMTASPGATARDQDGARQQPKMHLEWVRDDELDLLTNYRAADEPGKMLITMAAERVKIAIPPPSTNKQQ